jgi:hypothetical protein
MTTNRPWWMNPTNRFANAIYPHLTEASKEKAQSPRAQRQAQSFHARRGFVSPLGGQAVQAPPTEQKRK